MERLVDYTNKAVENFCVSTLEVSSNKQDSDRLEDIYTTMIKISAVEKEHTFFLCMKEDMLLKLSQNLLFEDNPEMDVMIDLLNESANLIVGNAKVVWEESEEGVVLQLSTPEYQGFFEKSFSKKFDDELYFDINGASIMIGIESIKKMEIVH